MIFTSWPKFGLNFLNNIFYKWLVITIKTYFDKKLNLFFLFWNALMTKNAVEIPNFLIFQVLSLLYFKQYEIFLKTGSFLAKNIGMKLRSQMPILPYNAQL